MAYKTHVSRGRTSYSDRLLRDFFVPAIAISRQKVYSFPNEPNGPHDRPLLISALSNDSSPALEHLNARKPPDPLLPMAYTGVLQL
ncbi:hypothetical protein LTR27_009356 [Elasticomyces elasticus]|nr:hypothetical protein LTR27_009356 [Elasticomyces elasticus]